MKNKIILITILVLAACVRLWLLGSLPQKMFGDEVDVGYHAWSLWTTGSDYTGQTLPTYIKSLSELRAPLLMYTVAPFVGVFGPSDWSVRIASVVTGVISIALIYFVAHKLFEERGKKEATAIALFSAFVLAISPWHIHYSRTAFEVSLLVMLILLSLFLYLYIDLNKKSLWFLVPLSFTFYTYSTANVFVPTLVLGLIFYDRSILKINKKKIVIALLAFLIALPSLFNLVSGKAGARFGLISIFSNQKIIDEVIVARTQPWSNTSDIYFNNKYVRIAQEFFNNYVGAWSPEFLFVHGDSEPRHNVTGFGEFFVFLLPLFVAGFAMTVMGKERSTKLLGYLLLVAPISSSLTYGGANHATRLFVFLPFLALMMGLGVVPFLKKRLNVVLIFVVVLSLISLVGWNRQMSDQYKFENERSWQFGYEDIFEQFAKLDDGKGHVYINNTKEPSLIRFAFYTRIQPVQFQKMFVDDKMTQLSPWLEGFSLGDRYTFGKVSFENLREINPGDYYIAAQGQEIPGDMDLTKTPLSGFETLASVRDAYGLPLFYVLKRNDQR